MRLLTGCATFAMLLSLAACGIPKEQYDKQVAGSKALTSELAKVRQDKESMQVKLGSLEKDLAKVRAALAQASSDLAAAKGAQAELDKLKAKMREQRKLNDKLTKQFKGMISAGQLKIVNVNGRLVIKMASRILFKAGKARLTRRGERALKRLARVLAKIPRHFQVAGHTDSQPIKKSAYKDNWQLSAIRAVLVVRVLEKNGVPGKNVSAAAFGPYQPVASNKYRRTRKLNRRIEITLLPVIPRRKD